MFFPRVETLGMCGWREADGGSSSGAFFEAYSEPFGAEGPEGAFCLSACLRVDLRHDAARDAHYGAIRGM